VAEGGGARGGARGGSGGGDLAAEARAGGRWHRLEVQEAVGDQCTTLGGGGWTRRLPKWGGDGEAPAIEEANDVNCFGSWRLAAPDLATGLTDARRRLGER
jgi:hypothetical protein